MAQFAKLPDGTKIKVPDDATPDEITALVNGDVGSGTAPYQAPPAMSTVEGSSPYEAGNTPTPREALRANYPVVEGGTTMAGLAGGAKVGAAMGAPFGPAGSLIGGIAGGGMGYLTAKRTTRGLLDVPQDTPIQDTAEGLGFAAIPPAVAQVGKGIYGAGKQVISRAAKIPPTKANATVRNKFATDVIKEDIGLSDKGLAKAVDNIGALDDDIGYALSRASVGTGPDAMIDVNKVSNNLRVLKHKFANRPNPQEYYSIIDGVEQELLNNPKVVNGQIHVSDAHALKKGYYQELDDFYSKIQGAEPPKIKQAQIENASKAMIAHTLRQEALAIPGIPAEIADKLGREASLMNVKRFMGRALNRAGNYDIVSFNDVLLGDLVAEGIPGVLAARIIRAPRTQVRIGIILGQMGKATSSIPAVGKTVQAGAVATHNLLSSP